MSCDNYIMFMKTESDSVIDVIDVGDSAGTQGYIRKDRGGNHYFDPSGYSGILCADQMEDVLKMLRSLDLVEKIGSWS